MPQPLDPAHGAGATSTPRTPLEAARERRANLVRFLNARFVEHPHFAADKDVRSWVRRRASPAERLPGGSSTQTELPYAPDLDPAAASHPGSPQSGLARSLSAHDGDLRD